MLGKNALDTKAGRVATFSLLYLTEGIPFGFSAIALTTYLRQQGVGLTEIGTFTAFLYLPWGFKWLVGPLVDLIRIERLGARRVWIAMSQVMMVATLGIVWWIDPGTNLGLLTALIAVHNVFAATQDVAIDALAVQVLPEDERGVANGFMFGASYVGQVLGGSGALWVAGAYGFPVTFPFVCGMLLVVFFLVTLRLNEPRLAAAEAVERAGGVLAAIAYRVGKYLMDLMRGFFLSGSGPVVGAAFGLMPFGALALGLALGSTMQVDLGMTENQIANLGLYSGIASALGCVVGGWVSDRLGHRKMLSVWFLLTTLPTFYLSGQFTGAAGMEGVTIETYRWVAIVYSLFSGLISGTSIAVFMGLTSPVVAATQFSGYMALRNLVYSYSAGWQGWFADLQGYAATLRLDAVIAFVPLIAIFFLRKPRPTPITGRDAARRLTKFGAVFALASPIAVSVAVGVHALDWRAGAVWGAGILALLTLTRDGALERPTRSGVALLTGVAIVMFVVCALGGWDRTAQLALLGAVFALASFGVLSGARHEAGKVAGIPSSPSPEVP